MCIKKGRHRLYRRAENSLGRKTFFPREENSSVSGEKFFFIGRGFQKRFTVFQRLALKVLSVSGCLGTFP